jgi:hypothetical protein
MGIYEILAGQSQILKLSIVHQNNNSISPKEHLKELQAFTKLVQQEAEIKDKAFALHVEESTSKLVQALKGNLAEFLTTPLHSDLEEIQGIILDNAKQLEKQYLIPNKINIYSASLSKYSADEVAGVKLKSLTLSAQRLLKSRGFSDTADRQALYASDFVVGGFDTLAVLESILAGLLASKVKPLFADSTFSFRVYDLFFPAEYRFDPEEKHEISMTIHNKDLDHSAAANNLKSWFETIGAGSFTWFLWKKRLISGFDGETVLEIRVKEKSEMKHLLQMISDNLDLFKKMFSAKEASLFVKERFIL